MRSFAMPGCQFPDEHLPNCSSPALHALHLQMRGPLGPVPLPRMSAALMLGCYWR
jgi:hypothetical protein